MKEEEGGGETQQEMNELSFMQAFSCWRTLGGEHWTMGSLQTHMNHKRRAFYAELGPELRSSNSNHGIVTS